MRASNRKISKCFAKYEAAMKEKGNPLDNLPLHSIYKQGFLAGAEWAETKRKETGYSITMVKPGKLRIR